MCLQKGDSKEWYEDRRTSKQKLVVTIRMITTKKHVSVRAKAKKDKRDVGVHERQWRASFLDVLFLLMLRMTVMDWEGGGE